MTDKQWEAQFKPKENRISGSGHALMFETYGDELAYVKAQPRNHVWTLLDCDGELVICAGYHFVNRIGYFITEVPWVTGDEEAAYE